MTIRHHPDDTLLAAFAAGTLDLGRHVAVSTHLVSCPKCRDWVRMMEHVGGAVLADLPPAAMADDALARVEAMIGVTATTAPRPAAAPVEAALAGLPEFVRHYQFGHWRWIAPRVRLRSIALPQPSDTRVFLLKSGPGTRMLQHSHTGTEMTCVLSGAFWHEGGHFGPGDFDLGDPTVDHRPVVDAEQECICLVAMEGDLKLSGVIGRLVQPFVQL